MYNKDYVIKVDFKVLPRQFPFDTKAVFINGDVGCKMTVHLVNGESPIDLTNTFVTINIKESNENVYSLACEILDQKNGVISINLPHSLNDEVGANIFEIVIRNSDDSVFVSPLLKYRVVAGIGTGDIPEEEPKLLILDTLISKVHKLDVDFQDGIMRISQLESSENIRISNENERVSNENERQRVFDSIADRVNDLIASGTNDLEVKDARMSLDGVVYDTLTQRINAIETNDLEIKENLTSLENTIYNDLTQRINAIETNPYILFEIVEG